MNFPVIPREVRYERRGILNIEQQDLSCVEMTNRKMQGIEFPVNFFKS